MKLSESSSESAELNAYKGDKDKGLGAFGGGFVGPNEASMTHQPAEGSFDDPAPSQDLEAPCGVGAFYHFNFKPGAEFHYPMGEGITCVFAIDPNQSQPSQPAEYATQKGHRSFPLWNIRCGDLDPKDQSQRVHQQMAFSPLDVLGSVITSDSAMAVGFDVLAVQNRRCGTGSFADKTPYHGSQLGVDALPEILPNPGAENVKDRLVLRKVLRQQPPRATCVDDIEYRVDHPAKVGSGSSPTFGGWKHRFYDFPLGIGDISAVLSDFHRSTELSASSRPPFQRPKSSLTPTFPISQMRSKQGLLL